MKVNFTAVDHIPEKLQWKVGGPPKQFLLGEDG